jgi:hypothetical protein
MLSVVMLSIVIMVNHYAVVCNVVGPYAVDRYAECH